MFDYYVWDANETQKAAVDKAMAAIVKSGILKDRFDISIDVEFVNTSGGGCIDMEDGEFTIEINKRFYNLEKLLSHSNKLGIGLLSKY